MKTKDSSNRYEDGKGISAQVSQNKMQETAKLQGKNSGNGKEQSYDKEFGEEKEKERKNSGQNEITGETKKEDVKKEFEIRSGTEGSKGSQGTEKKREGDPEGELEEVDSERDNKDISGSWRKSYKGDAEVVS